MRIKEFSALVKADDGEQGQFTAVVSVFGNKDSYGDVVMPGAFTDTLASWKASGNPIPVIWSHDWSDPFSHIGAVDPSQAQETEKGLQVTGQLDIDNAKAAQVYKLLKSGRVNQFSFAYDVEDGAFVDQKADDGTAQSYYELRKLKLYEVGPTLVGANQETELLAVKANALVSGLKEGRVLASKHISKLKDAHEAIGAVISAAEKDEASSSDDEKAAPTGAEAKDASRPDPDSEAAAKAAADEFERSAAQAIARLQLITA